MNNTLNVAIATDTILYAPFYLALYGGDFEDTPYGKLDINIIGQEGDMFFLTDGLPSKTVDGFVTLALLFGYADIGICDPSFIMELYATDDFERVLKEPLKGFINSLLPRERNAFYERFNDLFDGREHSPCYSNIETKFKNKFDVKVIGGLIQKVAFFAVGKKQEGGEKKKVNIMSIFDDDSKSLSKEERGFNEVVAFPEPSTGYYVGNKIAMNNTKTVQYGEELSYIISDKNTNDIALSCDFVSILQLSEKLDVHKDFVKSKKGAMFTGILANLGNKNNTRKYKAFLYGIEKNLFNIDKILKKKYDNDLSVYFKTKLLDSKNKYYRGTKDLISLLVSDIKVEENLIYDISKEIKERKDDTKCSEKEIKKQKTEIELTKNIDDLIYSFVQQLYDWKRSDKFLYYNSTNQNIEDLKTIYKIRTGKDFDEKNTDLKKMYDFTLLNDWRKEDRTITQKHRGWLWRTITNDSVLLLFASIFVALEIIGIYLKVFHIKFETSIPSYIHYFIIGIFTFLIVYLYWTSHRYLNYNKNKKYVFDLDNKKKSKLLLWINKKFNR